MSSEPIAATREQRLNELPFVLALSVLAGASIWFEGPAIIRVPLGLVAMLLLPGYCLIATAFPSPGDFNGVERAALGFGLSLAIITIVALGREWLARDLGFRDVALGLTVFSTGMSVIAWWRRRRWAPSGLEYGSAFAEHRSVEPMGWLAIFGLVALACAAGLSLATILRSSASSSTEFFIVAPDGQAKGYPRSVAPGESMNLNLGITNREAQDTTYEVSVEVGNEFLARLQPIQVRAGDTWTSPVTIWLNRSGKDQEIQIHLLKQGEAQSLRRLRLWVDVR